MTDDTVTDAAEERSPNPGRTRSVKRNQPFDVTLGARIRVLRIAAKMSQTSLGDAIGVSFQQVQKYERGRDRVTVSALKRIADALSLHPGSFFDDDMPVSARASWDLKMALKSADVLGQIHDPQVLKQLLALAEALAGGNNSEAERAEHAKL